MQAGSNGHLTVHSQTSGLDVEIGRVAGVLPEDPPVVRRLEHPGQGADVAGTQSFLASGYRCEEPFPLTGAHAKALGVKMDYIGPGSRALSAQTSLAGWADSG